jgi:integrase
VRDWLRSRPKTTRLRDQTATAYLVELAGELPPSKLRQAHINATVENYKTKLSVSTCWWYTYALGKFLEHFSALTLRTDLEKPRVRQPSPRTVIATPEEIGKLISAAQPWMRVLLQLCVSLALRLSEALDVRPGNATSEQISFRAKGGETQSMPITPDIREALDRCPPGDKMKPLVELYRGKPVSIHAAHHEWLKLKKQTGVNPNLIIHDLRRTTAVTAYEISKDLRAVEQILRHRNLATTTRYLEHRDTGKLQQLLTSLWEVPPTETKQ